MSQLQASPEYYKKCNMCKLPIGYLKTYWVCNVSTCNRKRTGLSFCSVSCWDAHLPMMNHREAWAEERKAPTFEAWQNELAGLDENGEPIKRTRTVKEEQATPEPPKPAPRVILRKKN